VRVIAASPRRWTSCATYCSADAIFVQSLIVKIFNDNHGRIEEAKVFLKRASGHSSQFGLNLGSSNVTYTISTIVQAISIESGNLPPPLRTNAPRELSEHVTIYCMLCVLLYVIILYVIRLRVNLALIVKFKNRAFVVHRHRHSRGHDLCCGFCIGSSSPGKLLQISGARRMRICGRRLMPGAAVLTKGAGRNPRAVVERALADSATRNRLHCGEGGESLTD